MGGSSEEEYSASFPHRAESLVERFLVTGGDDRNVDSLSRDPPDMGWYIFCEGVDRLVCSEFLAESEPRADHIGPDYFSGRGVVEELNLGESCGSEPYYEDVVCFLDAGSTYCSDAACGGFYHGAFFEREFGGQWDYCSSRDVVLWDAEVFCEAAWVNVGPLEFVAERVVAAGTISALVTWDVVVRHHTVPWLVSERVVRDFFDCAAHLVS